MTILSDSLSQEEDGTWTFQCPGVAGDRCGDEVPFRSSGWPTKKSASARGQQHFGAHKGDPMQELHDFRVEQGLVVDDDGVVRVEDL